MIRPILITLSSGLFGGLMVFILQCFIKRREQRYERRLHILRQLLANSYNVLSFDFISAFNMILIEYNDPRSSVKKWHEEFIECARQRPINNQGMHNALIILAEEIAKSINIKIEQLDIANKIYWPQGFQNHTNRHDELSSLQMENQRDLQILLKKINKSNGAKLEINTPKTK